MSDDSIVENKPSSVDNRIVFEINKRLDPKHLDILSLFLENKKQSGGGDILKLEEDSETGKWLTVIYEEADVQKRVLAKKFFKFQNYVLRSSQNGYKQNCIYPLDKKRILLKNIPSGEEELVVQMYAEYLLPDNQVNEVTQLQFIPNTFSINYEDDIDIELLQKRHKKKPVLRSCQIEVLNTYKTDTLIVGSQKDTTVERIWEILNENFPRTLKTDTTPFMFLEETDNKKFICQFDDANIELLARITLKENGFESDYCFNFDLINFPVLNIEKLSNKFNPNQATNLNAFSSKVLCNKAVQTESNYNKISPVEKGSVKNLSDKESIKASINSLSQKLQTKNHESANVLLLDPQNPCTIGLLNSKQTFINFEEYLNNNHKSLSLSIVTLSDKKKQILVTRKPKLNQKDDKDWKDMFLSELNKFFTIKATFQTFKIPADIITSKVNMDLLKSTLIELNRTCSAVFFQTVDGEIQGYGLKKSVKKQFESIPLLFKTFIGPAKKQGNKLFGNDLAVQIEYSSLLHLVLLSCKTILSDFKKNIQDLSGNLVKYTNENGENLKVECVKENADPISWTKSIRCLIESYETSRLKQKRLTIPPNLRREKEMKDLSKHIDFHYKLPLNNLCYTINQDSITAQGYTANLKNFVDNIHSKFINLENNIKDRIRRKLDVKIDIFKYPSIPILSNSNGYYLKEFSNQLIKLEASIELINTEATKLKITCQMAKNKLQNEPSVQTWRKNIDTFLGIYFSKFKVKRFSFNKADAGKLSSLGVNEKMKSSWIDDSTVEIIGLSTEISNIQINSSDQKKSDGKGTRSNGVSDLSTKVEKSSPQETFQISDLKWFQTRMLFEKKYFQFVSETYTNLEIMIDTNLTWILYTGQKQDIEDAKKLAFDILDKILGTEVEADKSVLDKMLSKETDLENLIKHHGLCCTVDAKSDNNKYTIYGTTPDEIGKCKLILSEIGFDNI